MHREFPAITEGPDEHDDLWIAYCPEIPGANGQGDTEAEALDSLREAIDLILECNREQGMKSVPETANRTVVVLN